VFVSSKQRVCHVCGYPAQPDANYCINCGAKLEKAVKPLSKENFLSVANSRWLRWAAVAFLIELVIFFALSSLPMSAQTAQTYASGGKQLVDSVRNQPLFLRILAIFENNFRIASIELVPFFGVVFFGVSTYQTAQIIEAFGINSSLNGPILMLSLLFLPHSWLELPAYAVATYQGLLLSVSIFRKRFFQELGRTLFVLLIVGVELFVAAIFEGVEITLQNYGSILPLVTWLPFFVIAGLVYNLIKKVRQKI
jgi:uncharacterized membrane protein SpoIIM required for sporulation